MSLANGIHEIHLHLYVYTLKRNTGDPETYLATVARPLIQDKKRFVHRRRSPESRRLHHGSIAGNHMP